MKHATQPNYSYCVEYCPGVIVSCSAYVKGTHKQCKHYELLQQCKVPDQQKNISRSKLETVIAQARTLL